jgi:hypothetical protein
MGEFGELLRFRHGGVHRQPPGRQPELAGGAGGTEIAGAQESGDIPLPVAVMEQSEAGEAQTLG